MNTKWMTTTQKIKYYGLAAGYLSMAALAAYAIAYAAFGDLIKFFIG